MEVLLKGLLRLFVLHSAAKPVSGQEVSFLIKKLSGGEWKPSPGTIYPLLSSLVKKGFLTRRKKGRKISYSITPKGRGELQEGKGRLLQASEKMMRMCMPLVMTVVHGFSESEVEEFRRDNEGFLAFRKKLLEMPRKKRFGMIREMMEKCGKAVE
jgi:DNA-binding PadR family transcriptional regulator